MDLYDFSDKQILVSIQIFILYTMFLYDKLNKDLGFSKITFFHFISKIEILLFIQYHRTRYHCKNKLQEHVSVSIG